MITVAEVEGAAERARVPSIYQEIFPDARRRIVAATQEVERGSGRKTEAKIELTPNPKA